MRYLALAAVALLLSLLLYPLVSETDGDPVTTAPGGPGVTDAGAGAGAGAGGETGLVRQPRLAYPTGAPGATQDSAGGAAGGSIRGRVVDAAGQLVARFSTLAWESGRRSPKFVREWMDGEFLLAASEVQLGFSVIPANALYGDRVHVPKSAVDKSLASGETLVVVVPRPDAQMTLISGIVVDDRGLGVPGATVTVNLLKGGDTGNIGYCVADIHGRFRRRFDLSQYGECYVSLRAAHHERGVSEPRIQRLRGGDVVCDEPLVIPSLTPAVFRFLDPSGRVVDGLRVSLSNGATWTHQFTTDTSGTIETNIPKECLIHCKKSLLGTSRILRHDVEKHGRHRVITVRRSGTLTGTVRDHRGQPLRAHVEVRSATGTPFLQTGMSKADGSFTFEVIPTHARLLVRAYSAPEGATTDIHVIEPGDVRPIQLALVPKLLIRLQVDAPKGMRVGRVMALVRDQEGNTVFSSEIPLNQPVNCYSLPAGGYTLQVSAPGFASSVIPVKVKAGVSPVHLIPLAAVHSVHVVLEGWSTDWPSEDWILEQCDSDSRWRHVAVIDAARMPVDFIDSGNPVKLRLVTPSGAVQGTWTGPMQEGRVYVIRKGESKCTEFGR